MRSDYRSSDVGNFEIAAFVSATFFFSPFTSIPINAHINVAGPRIREQSNKTVSHRDAKGRVTREKCREIASTAGTVYFMHAVAKIEQKSLDEAYFCPRVPAWSRIQNNHDVESMYR